MSTTTVPAGAGLAPTPEQEDLRANVRDFLARRFPVAEALRLAEDPVGFEPARWRELGAELGLLGIRVPTELGGAGLSFVEQAVLLEETGRVVLAAPFFATAVLATELLLEAGDAGAEALSAIAAGRLTATAALVPGSAGVIAIKGTSGWTLSGVAAPVIAGHAAELVLFPARAGDEIAVFEVERSAAGHRVGPLQGLDLTRRTSRHELHGTPARLLIDVEAAPAALERLADLAAVALAAELSGAARAVLDMSVAYAKERYQYGRAIGSFQAVKHRIVDMLVGADSIRTAAIYAAWAAANAPAELGSAAPLAFSVAASEAVNVTGSAIQVHGGIGMTWEHPLHLYFRRAKSAELTMGSVAAHRERLARRLWPS